MQSLKIVAILLVALAAYAAAGSVKIRNTGGYTAIFHVDYDHGGKRQSASSGDFTLGVNKAVSIPDGAKNIYIKAEEYWIGRQKTTIFTKTLSAISGDKCFKIWGTTLSPKYSEEKC